MLAEVDAVLGVDLVEGNGEEEVVDVVAAEVCVTVGGLDLKDAVVELEDGDVEGAAAEIIDGDGAGLGAVETVGERCGGGLVDEAEDFEASHATCVLGGLALRVVEVGGHGDDGLRDRLAEETLGVALELAEDVGGYLGWGEAHFAELDAGDFALLHVAGEMEGEELEFALHLGEAAAHEALDGVDDALGGFDEGAAGAVAHGDGGAAAFLHRIERDDGRHEVGAVDAGNDYGRIALHVCDEGVGGSQVDANYAAFRHCVYLRSQGFSDVADEIGEIAAAIEEGHHDLLRVGASACVAGVPRGPLLAQV